MIVKPLGRLSVDPNTFVGATISISEVALSVLFAVHPRAIIFTSVYPCHAAMTFFLVFPEFSNIDSAVSVAEHTSAMHLVSKPVSFVDATICPRVLAFAVDVVLVELSDKAGSIAPVEVTLAVFPSIGVLAFVLGAIKPGLNAPSMLFVFTPHALVLSAIEVQVLSLAISFVVLPFADIHITVGMN